MPKRVTPEEIKQFHKLYQEYGSFAAVARLTGRSASTISRYVQVKGAPRMAAHTFKEIMHE